MAAQEITEKPNIWQQYASKLAGGWKCISYLIYDSERPDKKLIGKPHGNSPLGRVLLSPNGYISAHMAVPERMQPFESGRKWQNGNKDEIAHVAKGLSMYAGYLKLYEDEKGLFWQTKVEIASDPHRMEGIEERRARYWEEDGKAFMELVPKQDMLLVDGDGGRAVLVWEKFE